MKTILISSLPGIAAILRFQPTQAALASSNEPEAIPTVLLVAIGLVMLAVIGWRVNKGLQPGFPGRNAS